MISDEEWASRLLAEHLERQGKSEFRCELNSCDPPDLLVIWKNLNVRWGVEVARTYLQVENPLGIGRPARRRTANQSRPPTRSAATITELLRTFGEKLGEATKDIRKRDYILDLGPSPTDSLRGRPMDFSKQWQRDTENAIREHILDDRTGMKRPGVWLKPGGSGNCWTVTVHPGVQEIGVATLAMLNRELKKKVEDLPRWNGSFAERWLLLLNCYPLAPNVSEVETALKQLWKNTDCSGFDGIFWNGCSDCSLVSIPAGQSSTTTAQTPCSEIAEDMEKRVEYEGREKSQDYMRAMADVVRPFYKELKNEPQREPPFNS